MAGGGKRVLMVGGEGVVLFSPAARGMEREMAIAWDAPGFDTQLAAALGGKGAGRPVLVLFDGADQAYRKEENVPKLSPFDRPRYVRRKLELAFPSYPIRAALEIKPQAKKKLITVRAETATSPSYLFAALPETENLDRVGAALFESGVPVAGFGLLPIESAGLVSELARKAFKGARKPARWSVLIGQHETGGLRQVVVRDGNLALARLTPPTEAGVSGAGWAEEAARSFKETMAYISRFGYTPADGLDIVVVCGDLEKTFFDGAAMDGANFTCLNPGEALKLMGVRSFGLAKSNFADVLHAAWASRQRALVLPVRVPSIHRVMAPRLAARMATGALAIAALGVAAMAAMEYQSYLSVSEELENKRNLVQMRQREFEQESRAFDALPVKPAQVKAVLTVRDHLAVNSVDPAPILNRLKDALGGDVILDKLSYEHAPGPLYRAAAAAGGAPVPVKGDPASRGTVRISFAFKLPPAVPLEQKVARAEALEKDLQKAFPGWTAKIDRQFGGISRQGAFQGIVGGDKTAQEPPEAAEFSLEGAPW
jgi:hypothetical protein